MLVRGRHRGNAKGKLLTQKSLGPWRDPVRNSIET